MIHLFYLFVFAFFAAIAFGLFSTGTPRDKMIAGAKSFAQFVGISLLLGWVFYFIPWN